MEKTLKKTVDAGKRDFLKKAAVTAFAVPTIQTFAISDLHAAQSGGNAGYGDGDGGGQDKSGGK